MTSQTPRPSEDRYRLLVEAVTDYAIYMLNPDGIIVSWNPGAKRFKGYEESEVVGQHFSKFTSLTEAAQAILKVPQVSSRPRDRPRMVGRPADGTSSL